MIITGGLATAGVEVFLQSFATVNLRPRNAPEFVNMRHRPTGDPARPVDDMSRDLGADFDSVLDQGGYQAALFEDSIADGCITANVGGLPFALACKPAFSVIAAPEFFPYADEIDLKDWVDAYPSHNRRDQFKNGGPSPLNLGRFPPNITLFWPGSTEPRAFSPNDDTAVAIVGASYASGSGPTQANLPSQDVRPENRTTTYLSDGCSDVFAPGWDITFAERGRHAVLRDVRPRLAVPRGRETMRGGQRILARRLARRRAHLQSRADRDPHARSGTRLPSRQSPPDRPA